MNDERRVTTNQIFAFVGSILSCKNMFKDDDVSCWNSEGSSPQYIFFDFLRPVKLSSVSFMFQGGFVGQDG